MPQNFQNTLMLNSMEDLTVGGEKHVKVPVDHEISKHYGKIDYFQD